MTTISTDLDASVARLAPRAFALLADLIEQRSTVGQEGDAQEVLADALESAGFAVQRMPIPEAIADDPAAGIPRLPYAGRYDLIGRRGNAAADRTLVVNGHIDVVPADDERAWTSPPFTAVERDGWLHGRGAGDMKGGFAAGLLALWALDEVDPGWLTGGLTLVSAIEEEYTGNGTLAAARAGHLGQAALLLEPTDLDVLLAGIAITWVTIELPGLAGHAEAALHSVNPVLSLGAVIDALRALEAELNAAHAAGGDPAFAAMEHPYNLNIGTVSAGDWPSSVPASARLEVRVGHPADWSSEQALERVRRAVTDALAADPWFAGHPPVAHLSGFRAQRYAQSPDVPLVSTLAAAHADVHGGEPARFALASTTDARFYVNQFGMDAAAYGPRARNIHGTDEAVELASVVDCARVVARFLRDWYATGGAA